MTTGTGEASRPPAVLLGGSYNALSAARSLHARGVQTHVMMDGRSRLELALRSSRAVARAHVPNGDLWSSWMATLHELDEQAVLIPGSDEGIEFLVSEDDAIRRLGHIPIEHGCEVNLAFLDKGRTYELALAAGVPTASVSRVESIAEARARATVIGYPCLLKPTSSHEYSRRRGHDAPPKGAIARDLPELEHNYAALETAGVPILLAELIPGPDSGYCSYYTFIDDRGVPLLHFTKRKPRQYPVGIGSGTFHVTDWAPDVAELGLALFRASSVRGIANVEFKRDVRDGRLKLIECNLRITAADGLVRRAGIDLPWLAYRRAIGERDQVGHPEPVGPSYRTGLKQWLPRQDARAALQYRRAGELSVGRWLQTLAPPVSTPIFSFADPGPTARNALSLVRTYRGRAR